MYHISSVQSVLSCIMLAIVCFLAALFAMQNLCAPKPKSAGDWACHVAVGVLFALVFVHLCRSVRSQTDDAKDTEAFATKQDWGADPNDDDVPPASFDSEHADRIVGPDPKSNSLNTWQYNPQNTLVDYKFYNKSEASPACERLAPVVDGSVGKSNGGFVHTGDVYYNRTSTRNPSPLSNAKNYVTNSAASNAPPITPTVSYTWPYDGQVAASGGNATPCNVNN